MAHTFASLFGALAATTLLAGAGVASAETLSAASLGAGYTATDAPLGAPTELRIDLVGRVAARCNLVAPPVLSNHLNVSRAGRTEAAFSIDCNAPFNLRVRSSAGGFSPTRAQRPASRPWPLMNSPLPCARTTGFASSTGATPTP